MAEIGIDISVKGLESIRYIAAQIPENLPLSILPNIMPEVAETGVIAMKDSVRKSVGRWSTGHLENSVESSIIQEGEDDWRIAIGSPLGYSRFVVRAIGPTPLFRPVQIRPPMRWAGALKKVGDWRYIRVRPAMPKKFTLLEDTAEAAMEALRNLFGDQLAIKVRDIDALQKMLSMQEERL